MKCYRRSERALKIRGISSKLSPIKKEQTKKSAFAKQFGAKEDFSNFEKRDQGKL